MSSMADVLKLSPVIAVDGPSGSGKGTICARLARYLDFHLLDSGALYRLLAMAAVAAEQPLDDSAGLARLATDLDVSFLPASVGEPVRPVLAGREVTGIIRHEEWGSLASRVAVLPAVREALLQCQRDFRRAPGLVADGRDMGTVVFPDARVKIFVTATPEARAQRRYKQLMEKGISVNLADLFEEIVARDQRDRERLAAPTKPADDAVVLDTTHESIDEVFETVLRVVDERGALVEQ